MHFLLGDRKNFLRFLTARKMNNWFYPVFNKVDSSKVCKQERNFKVALAKQKRKKIQE